MTKPIFEFKYLSIKNKFNLGLFRASCFSFLFLILLISKSPAQVAVDTVSDKGVFSQTGVLSFSWNHTITQGGISRVLYVAVSSSSEGVTTPVPLPIPNICTIQPLVCGTALGTASQRVNTVTFQGQTMERVGTSSPSANLLHVVEIFRLVNPPEVISGTVTVTFLTANVYHAVGGSISFTGADEPPIAGKTLFTQNGTNADPLLTVNGGAGNSGIALGVVATSPNAGYIADDMSSVGQISRWNGRDDFFNAYDVGAGSTKPASPSTLFDWNLSNSNEWATAGVFVQSFAPSASPSTISGQITTSDGSPLAFMPVSLQNLETGEEFYTQTNEKGLYIFEELETARMYQVRVTSIPFTFLPDNHVFQLIDSMENVNFVASRRNRR